MQSTHKTFSVWTKLEPTWRLGQISDTAFMIEKSKGHGLIHY